MPSAKDFVRGHMPGLALLLVALLSTGYTLRLVVSYFRLFNISVETMLDGEVSKTISSRALQYRLIERINRTLPKESVIMVFRVADFAFYGKRKYISYLDEKIADHAKYKTPDDVWHYLRQKGISHIYLPPYSIPSHYNSGLEGLLASPSHSTLLYDFKGFRLFEIRKNLEPVQMTLMAGEDFSTNLGAKKNWILSPDMSEAAGKAGKRPGILITGRGGLLSRPDRKAIAYRGRMKFKNSPLLNKIAYNFQDNGIYQFQAAVEGQGFLKIFLEKYHYENGEYGRDTTPLWAGVLNGNRRSVKSIFAVVPKQIFQDPMLEKSQAYRLVFELGSGKFAQIHNWSMKQVHYNAVQPFQMERLQRSLLMAKGWHIKGKPGRSAVRYGLDTGQDKASVFVLAQNSRRLVLESPVYYNFENMSDRRTSSAQGNGQQGSVALPGSRTKQFDPKIKQSLAFSFQAKGEGVLGLTAKIRCQEAAGQDEEEHDIVLYSVALSPESRTVRRSFYSPCAFSYLWLQVVIKPDDLSAQHSGRKPAAIALQDLVMSVKYIGLDQKITTQNLKEMVFPVQYYDNDSPSFWRKILELVGGESSD